LQNFAQIEENSKFLSQQQPHDITNNTSTITITDDKTRHYQNIFSDETIFSLQNKTNIFNDLLK